MKLGNRLSNKICPDNMTIEEWQVALRRENARESDFTVEHLDKNRIWGDSSSVAPPAATVSPSVAYRAIATFAPVWTSVPMASVHVSTSRRYRSS